MGEAERGESAPRVWVSFWCANKHETRPSFATDAAIPETWECPRCGNPAGQNEQQPPDPPRVEPYKTHLAYVKERRSDSDGEAILAEALARLRGAATARAAPRPGSACSAQPRTRSAPDPLSPGSAAARSRVMKPLVHPVPAW